MLRVLVLKVCGQITWRTWESRVASSLGLEQARERAVDKFPGDAGLAVRGLHFEKHGQGGEGSPAADRAPSLGIALKQWRACRLMLIAPGDSA